MTMRKVLLLLSFFALPLAAQTTTIRGRVALPDGDPLPGVTVTADDFGVTAVTSAEGRYELSIPSDRVKGPVKVTASLAGLVRNANGAFTAQGNNGIFTYPINTPFGMNGRFVYTRVGYTF